MALINRRTLVVYRVDYSGIEPVGDVDMGEFKFKELNESDFKRDPLFEEKNRADKFCGRLSDGHRCLGFVASSGEIAAYIWYSVIPAPFEMGLTFKASEQNAYLWDCRTAPQFERRQLYRLGLRKTIKIMGAKNNWIVSNRQNIPSQKGIEAAGFDKLGELHLFRIYRLVGGWSEQLSFCHIDTGSVSPAGLSK